MLRCRLLGHRFRFSSDGDTMRWRCERGCGAEGAKRYPTAADASLYARALDREDRADLGRRALPFSLLPLRLAQALRGHRGSETDLDRDHLQPDGLRPGQ
jgi:hypothetical protein